MFWKVNFSVEEVFILGGGVSLLREDLNLIKNKFIIGVNSAFKLGKWVDVCYFGDCRFYTWNKEELDEFSKTNLVITTCDVLGLNEHKYIKVLRKSQATKENPIDWRPDYLAWHSNSGASALALACKLGVKKIILIGFDMKVVDGKHNWHNYHKVTPSNTVYNRFKIHFEWIKEEADKKGIEIFNTCLDSALDVFPKISLEKLV